MNKYRELRMRTGLSAQKFGDKYGIPMRTVQAWEYEKASPPEYVYKLLRRAVDEDMEQFNAEVPEEPEAPIPDEETVEKLKEVCDELIAFIRKYE